LKRVYRIKYLEQSFKQARGKGLETDYVFFLLLKSINTSGYFSTKNYLSYIRKCTNFSKTTIKTRFNSLLQNNLAHKKYNNNNQCIGIEIVSYDKAWYDVLEYQKRANNTGFKNYYEIYKICTKQFDNKNELIQLMHGLDIWRNYQRRQYKSEQFNNQTSRIKKAKSFELSQLSTALILGYKSSMTGCRKQKQLKKANILQTFRNSAIISRQHILQYKQNYVDMNPYRTFFQHEKDGYGYVRRRLCNTLWINCNTLFSQHNNTNQGNVQTAKAI